MQVIEDKKRTDRIFIVFSFEELEKIVRESTRTQTLRRIVIKRILEWGINNFHYLSKNKAFAKGY